MATTLQTLLVCFLHQFLLTEPCDRLFLSCVLPSDSDSVYLLHLS